MQDIDFDELDRAVNSVISDASAPAPEHEEREAPEVKREVEVPERKQISRPTVSPAARRSNGRFMDVVHPSSDMRPKGSAAPAPTPSRTAETVTPPAPKPAPFRKDRGCIMAGFLRMSPVVRCARDVR